MTQGDDAVSVEPVLHLFRERPQVPVFLLGVLVPRASWLDVETGFPVSGEVPFKSLRRRPE
jgi:hypothetical protein